MSRTRKGIVLAWAGMLGIAAMPGVSAAGSGLLDPSVCLSPIVFGALILTPTATLSDAATKAVNKRLKNQ